MTDITTEHNGHMIRYSENEDKWTCWAMSVEAKTLSALKTKLNKLDADSRRVNVTAIKLSYHTDPESAHEVTVTVIEPQREAEKPRWGSTTPPAPPEREAWVTYQTSKYRGVDKPDMKREKVELKRLLPATPEVRAMLKKARDMSAAIKAAQDELKRYVETIPRYTAEDLMAAGLPEKKKEDAEVGPE